MPRAKKSMNDMYVVGPSLRIDGREIVSFKTEFKADGVSKLDQAALSAAALKNHNDFIQHVATALAQNSVELDLSESLEQ